MIALTNKTVHNDFAVDTLTGGFGQDWFLASTGSGGDMITDLNLFAPPDQKKGETVTPINK
jgi:hypothetical protein